MKKYNIYNKGQRINRTALTKEELDKICSNGIIRLRQSGSSVYRSYPAAKCEIVECIIL